MEAFGLKVDDKSRLLPGLNSKRAIITPDGYEIPLSIQRGLVYMDTDYPLDEDLATLPAIFMTADSEWDPSIYDNYHDICQQNDLPEDSESDTFQSLKSQEIGIFETYWEYNELDLGDFYQYDDPIFIPALDMPIFMHKTNLIAVPC